jgi:hypothetical protein
MAARFVFHTVPGILKVLEGVAHLLIAFLVYGALATSAFAADGVPAGAPSTAPV